ncbi:MAG: patatin-like phospholipase family protein [Rhodoglobus sp.]
MNHSLQNNFETSSDVAPNTSRTALVLGGGGSTGNAWLIGVVAGLAGAGVDVTGADLIVGTSAGATAAAQLTGAVPAELFADILSAVPQARTGSARPAPTGAITNAMDATAAVIAASADAVDMRRRMGAWGLGVDAASPRSAQWRAVVAARLPRQQWPEQRMLITAVDARTGEPVVFDRHSGVDLVDAVAASTAGGFAYSIGDRQFIDGGYRTNADNADLASGFGRVLVLSPFGGRSRLPFEWGMHLETQVDELRASGSTVETIFPDSNSEHLFGPNGLDLTLRPPAARAGHEQGVGVAGQLKELWG